MILDWAPDQRSATRRSHWPYARHCRGIRCIYRVQICVSPPSAIHRDV